MFDLTGSVAFC